MNKSHFIFAFYLTVVFATSFFSGCNGGADADASIAKVNESNIQRLANLYFTFQMKNSWRGPDNEDEFKGFISGYDPRKLTRIGIDPNAIDALFISERDGQPFMIRYSVRGSVMGSSEPVIFESEGIDGSRLVGFLNMVQRKVDEEEYRDLWEGKTPIGKEERDAPVR